MDKQREAFEAWAQSENMSIAWGVTNYLFSETAKAWKAWQHLSHAEGETPFAWHRGGRAHEMLFADDLDGAPTDLSDGWEPLFKRPAPQVAVPEGWTDRHTRVTRFALWRLINEGYHRANVAAQKGQPGTADDAAALLDDVKRAEEARNMLAAPTAPAGESAEIPEIGSQWRHRNGNVYTVESITNESTERPGQYPVTVVYRGDNGKLWSRPAHDWHRSMTFESAPEQPVSDPDGLLTRAADLLRCLRSVGYDFQYDDNGICCGSVSADWAEVNSVAEALEKIATPAPDEREIAKPVDIDAEYEAFCRWVSASKINVDYRLHTHSGRRVSDGAYIRDEDARRMFRAWRERATRLRAGKEGEPS